MPDVATTMLVVVPVGFPDAVAYLACSEVLIAAQYFQRLVLVIGYGIVNPLLPLTILGH